MKKITYSLVLTGISFFCHAQLPSQHLESLLNSDATITTFSPTLQEFSYVSFNKSAQTKLTEKTFQHPAAIAKPFKVLEVAPYEKYGATKFKIKLQSAANGTYYYDYDPKYDREYVSDVIADLELPAAVCADIDHQK